MGYLRRVPVELEQRPRLVSVTAVTVTGGSGGWKLEGWVGEEDGYGGQRSGEIGGREGLSSCR